MWATAVWAEEHRLYPYQERASDMMQQRDSLLAYEMGTGKTPTTLHAIETMRKDQRFKTGTVVVPSSLKYQWASEIAKFTDQQCVVIDGSPAKRAEQYWLVRETEPGYMVISYDNIVRDWRFIGGDMGTAFLVLDEATAIKSFTTVRSKHIKKIAKHYDVKIALTGTPMENGRLEELFSIMQFVSPGVLGGWRKFEEKYVVRNAMGWISGYRNVKDLRDRLVASEAFARASHSDPDVSKYLPRVVDMPELKVRLSPAARAIQEAIEKSILDDLDEFVSKMSRVDVDDLSDWEKKRLLHPDGKMMAKITLLRQFLSNPGSLLSEEDGSGYRKDLKESGLLDRAVPLDKMSALSQYLRDFFDTDPANKAVVFTSFVGTAHLINENNPESSVLLTGEMSAGERQKSIDAFKTNPDVRLFVSTDAGGYGLDLPQANLLVNYDLPWSPGMLAQRNARIKRASSKWSSVVVQNIVCEGTLEERILSMLEHKMSVAGSVVDGADVDEEQDQLESLRSFLAYSHR